MFTFSVKSIFSPVTFITQSALLAAMLLGGANARAGQLTATEFFNTPLGHYFMTADPGEKNAVDSGGAGAGWKRTDGNFQVYDAASAGLAGVVPICRFYARGPNSHFYTANAGECQALKNLETQQRAAATAQGLPFLGWQSEGIAFYAVAKVNNACPTGYIPVYRLYNNRGAQNDSNHRFTTDSFARDILTRSGWADEGIDFCAIGSGGVVTPPSGGVSGGLEDCGEFYPTTKTLTWQTTITSGVLNKVERSTDRPLGTVTFNGVTALAVRTQVDGSPDYEDTFLQPGSDQWSLLGARRVSSGSTETGVYEPALVLPKRYTLNQSVALNASLRSIETGQKEAIDQTAFMAGRQAVTLPNGTNASACIIRVAERRVQSDGSTYSVENDCLIVPGYGPVRAVVTVRAESNGKVVFDMKSDKVLIGVN